MQDNFDNIRCVHLLDLSVPLPAKEGEAIWLKVLRESEAMGVWLVRAEFYSNTYIGHKIQTEEDEQLSLIRHLLYLLQPCLVKGQPLHE